MNAHTSARPGKKVLVILRDGQRFVDTFVEKYRDRILVFTAHRVLVAQVRTMTYPKTYPKERGRATTLDARTARGRAGAAV